MNNLPDHIAAIDHVLRRGLASIPNAVHGRVALDDGAQFAVDMAVGQSSGIVSAASHVSRALTSLQATILIHSVPAGSLDIICVPATVLTSAMHDTAQFVAEQIGIVLERALLAGKLAQTVQQGRFLNEVLDAVADAASITEVVQTLSSGIHHVLPRQHWASVQLALRDEDGQHAHIYELQGQGLHPYWRNVQAGVRAAGRDLAVEVEFVAAPAEGARSQAVALAKALQAGVDGIAIAPIDAAALEPLIQQARQAGIPLITFDSPPLEDSASLLYVGIDNVAAGARAAQVMRQLLPAGGLVALSVDSLQTANGRQRAAGFMTALAGSELEALPPLDDQYSAERGQHLAQQTLESQPDLCGAFGCCGANGVNWARALADTKRASTVKLVCFDISADTIALLKAGTAQAVIAQREYAMGYRSVQVLRELIAEGVEPVLARAPSTRQMNTDVEVVTLLRTPWSISLADYLATVHDVEQRPTTLTPSARTKPFKISVIGMAEQTPHARTDQRVLIDPNALLGQVLQTSQPIVLAPYTAPVSALVPDAAARAPNQHTIVGVPLRARHGVLGMLRLDSASADACSPHDLALIRQIASAIAVVVENAQLVGQLAARQRDLEAATAHQQHLLGTLLELSSPVVPIMPGILLLPLIGALDTARMAQINAAVLAALTRHRATVVIVDITGAHSVDTYAAQHLLNMAHATRLLGAEVIVVGVSPAIADTLVTLGVNLAAITTCADLAHGLAIGLARRGARIVYASRS